MAVQNTQAAVTIQDLVQFLRKRDYKMVRELGQGACGKTVLLYDDQIDEHFVCKKYVPYDESERFSLFKSFVREIKLLHQVHHPNVIRVYNYYLYPDVYAGYILMEFVDGSTIEDFVKVKPEQVNELFTQAVSGFAYLERAGILHRDIRPGNIMVDHEGRVKIIDLGFGKRVIGTADFDKSITLNWWCQPPSEFSEGKYDFATEVYFVGKLFEEMVLKARIDNFKFGTTLKRMCQFERSARVQSFVDVERAIQGSQFFEPDFSQDQIRIYRRFVDAVAFHLTKIERGTKYTDDPDQLRAQLNEAYRVVMLEEFVPDAILVLRSLIVGTFYYRSTGFETGTLRDFVRMVQSLSTDQLRILLANLHERLDALPRYVPEANITDDDVPF